MIRVEPGDCLDVMRRLIDEGVQVQACVTDPPYHLTSIVKRFGAENAAPAKVGKTGAFARASRGFMGKQWDGGDVAFRPETWRLVYGLLPPGGHLLAFAGTRNYHRMACAVEDAGFEIRDMVAWLYGSGFPKSHDVSKGIDRAAGAKRQEGNLRTDGRGKWALKCEREAGSGDTGIGHFDGSKQHYHETFPATDLAKQWDGWGTALKPALEPLVLARKPLIGTVAENVLEHGTGALNVDGSRVATDENLNGGAYAKNGAVRTDEWGASNGFRRNAGLKYKQPKGRWPANVIHDGSEEVLEAFAAYGESEAKPGRKGLRGGSAWHNQDGFGSPDKIGIWPKDDGGTAARFFYSSKADAHDRFGSRHPTVKPVDLMAYLCRLVTPPGGTILDPFAGSGTTGVAAKGEGFDAILIEREEEYLADIKARLDHLEGKGPHKSQVKHRNSKNKAGEDTPLFGKL